MKVFENLFNKVVSKKHTLMIERENVLTVLETIDRYRNWFIITNLRVSKGSYDNRALYFVRFRASDEQWMSIIGDLEGNDLEMKIKFPENIMVTKIKT